MTIWLVVGFNHPEKWWSESRWVSDDIPYMKWKIKAMFQTTNQMCGLDMSGLDVLKNRLIRSIFTMYSE